MKQIVNIITFIFPWLSMAHPLVSNKKATSSGALQTGRNKIQQGHIMISRNCVAVDPDASSGCAMLVRYERECRNLTLREIHHFNSSLYNQDGHVIWSVGSLKSAIRLGLNKTYGERIHIDSTRTGTWDVDFVLFDQQGRRVGLPAAYRDSRTNGLMAQA